MIGHEDTFRGSSVIWRRGGVAIMKLRTTVLAALTAVSLAGTSGCLVPAGGYYDADVAPPPPRVVVEPSVRLGYVWAPGYWRWNGHQHVWTDGRYMRERRGYHWRADHWDKRGNRYHFERGHWER
jgi:hypothetical protein